MQKNQILTLIQFSAAGYVLIAGRKALKNAQVLLGEGRVGKIQNRGGNMFRVYGVAK